MNVELLKKENPNFLENIIFVRGAYHGAWCWHEHFMGYFHRFGYNVYAISFRNHGNKSKVNDINSITINDFVEDLKNVINMIQGKKNIIAHYLGCKVVQLLLIEKLQQIKSIVLISPITVRNNLLQLLKIRKNQFIYGTKYIYFSNRLNDDKCDKYLSKLVIESKKVEYSLLKNQKKFLLKLKGYQH